MKSIRNFFLSSLLILPLFGCSPRKADSEAVTGLLQESREALDDFHYSSAMGKAIAALELAQEASDQSLSAEAFLQVASVEMASTRDTQAWVRACESEAIAREESLDSVLAAALVIKGKLCSYAEVSADFNRNDEAISYLQEALSIAEEKGYPILESQACLALADVYVSKNRWNDVLDQVIYKKAGEYLARGQAHSDGRRFMATAMRYFQQGGQYHETVDLCKKILEDCDPTDFLMQAQMHDHLSYALNRLGEVDESLVEHQQCVSAVNRYIHQKADKEFQEIETKYEAAVKQHQLDQRRNQISILLLVLVLLLLLLIIVFNHSHRVHLRNRELEIEGKNREQMLAFITDDLANPTSTQREAIRELAASCGTMDIDTIRKKCAELVKGADDLNANVADYVYNLMSERQKAASELGITNRELEIIRLCAEGMSAVQIAETLFISPRTVNNHKQNIFSKMEVGNNAQMVQKARELGLI